MTTTLSLWRHTMLFIAGFTLFMVLIAWLVILDFEHEARQYAAGQRRRERSRRLVHRRRADDGQHQAEAAVEDDLDHHTAPRLPKVKALYRHTTATVENYPTMPLPTLVEEPIILLPLITETSYQGRHRLIEDTTELPVIRIPEQLTRTVEPDLAFMGRVLEELWRLG